MAAPPEVATAIQQPLAVDGSLVTLHETIQNDASLADAAFVDAELGWAVGDRGVIWHTADGGRSWQRQPSGVTCRLESVCFLDTRQGWAVGGATPPYSPSSKGVVLSTADGGNTWQQLPQAALPALRRVKFFDAERGVAIGAGTAIEPSGVYATRDGGRTWQPLPADERDQWLAGDLIDLDAGAVAGVAGRFATIMRRRVVHSPAATPSLRSYRALRLAAPTGGWLVGDGGLVLTTADLGRSWQTPPGDLPEHVAEQFDFHAVAVIGSHVWAAGSPGSRVFHSSDGGKSWQSQVTGQHVPIQALAFVDERIGWAVGDLGSIVATRDGGQTWQPQRQGGQRAALLAIFAHETDVPLELVAKYGGEAGYLAAVDVLRPVADARVHEALTAVGATATDSAWRFPLPPGDLACEPADLLAKLNEANDGRAIERLQAHLVRQLRMWRPEVVITHHGQIPLGQKPIDALMSQLVEHCLIAAADPTQFPELSTDADLSAWRVKRVYGVLPAGSRGDVRLATGQFAPRLGTTLANWVGPARRLLHPSNALSPDMIELELLDPKSKEAAAGGDLFREIHLAPGGDARRRLANLPTDDLETLRRLAARRRQMQVLIERSQGNAAWAGQVQNLLADLDDDSGGELLYQLAAGYRTAGRLDLAADAFALLARRWPDHPLTEPALRWLVQFYASSETALRSAGRGGTNARGLPAELPAPTDAGAIGVRQASAVAAVRADDSPVIGLARDDRLRRAVMLGEYLEVARPALFAEPVVRFPLVVAQRQLGYANPAKRYFLTLHSLPQSDPWRQCARTEEWFTEPEGPPPPKALGHCRRIDERPRLDGLLDEPFWDAADRLRLKTGRSSFSTSRFEPTKEPPEKELRPLFSEVRFAYDREFLYLAVRCLKQAGGDYASDDGPRPRDADLTPHDRVAIRIDTDRDYTTAFELAVDHRGWTRDSCWGDATWDPAWYVAVNCDEQAWTVEAAIPLAELTTEPPAERYVWAVAVRRTIPRVGYESWSGDAADAASPGQLGLLIFE